MIQRLKASLRRKALKAIKDKQRKSEIKDNHLKRLIIFFDATDTVEYQVVRKYADQLRARGSKVKLLAYLDSNKSTAELDIDHYNSKMLNWYAIPKDEQLNNLLSDQQYDAAIVLLSNIDKHHTFVISAINANLKIGPSYNEDEVLFDINVDHKSQLGLPELIKNIKQSIRTLTND